MIIGKRHLITGFILICVVSVLLSAVTFGGLAKNTVASKKELPIYSVETKEKQIALTFDAAWGAEDTEEIIAILKQYNATATFFVVGQWVDKYPEAVKALSDAGFDVMNHSDTHPHYTKLTAEEMIKETNSASDKIEQITGKRPNLLRAPYGDYNENVILTLRENNYQVIQWDVDSLDWKGISAEEIKARVLSKAKPGSIVLFHNAAEHTPDALPEILSSLTAQGYTFVKVNDLILKENYYLDHTGRQIPIENGNAQ